MADRYLLESGSPDGYLLEDGSGVFLLDTPPVTWSSADKYANVTLSNGDKTATGLNGVGAAQCCRGTTAKTTGKWYYEVRYDTNVTRIAIGFDNGATGVNSFTTPGQNDSNGITYTATSGGGSIYFGSNAASPPSVGGLTSGDIVGIAVDADAGTVWFAKNNTWTSGDPAAATGGYASAISTFYPYIGPTNNDAGTGRWTSADLTYSVPTGFTVWDGAASSSQTLTPSLFTNSQTFYAPTATAGAVALTPSLFTNSQTFFAPTVNAAYALTPSLFTNTQSFFAPTVTPGTVTLTPSLFSNAQTFYPPAVTATYALLPDLFTNAQTFYGPTVSGAGGSQDLQPALVTNAQVFYDATVSSAYALAASLFTNPQTFYEPSVSATVSLFASLLTNEQIFYAATIEAEVTYPAVTPLGWHGTAKTGAWSGADSGGGGAWIGQTKSGSWSGSDYSGGGGWIKRSRPNSTW